MLAKGYITVDEQDYKYEAIVSYHESDDEFIIDEVKRKGKSEYDWEVFYYFPFNGEWVDVSTDTNVIELNNLYNLITNDINKNYDKFDWNAQRDWASYG